LFGHERGSFTGAHQRNWANLKLQKMVLYFSMKWVNLKMLLQAKLLRVIQQKEFERVGGTELIKTGVRIILQPTEIETRSRRQTIP